MDGNLRQKEMAHHSLVSEKRSIEKGSGTEGQAASLEMAAFIEQHNRLVQIREPRPDFVLFLDEQGLGLSKEFDGAATLAHLTRRDGLIGEGLGRFVADLQLVEEQVALFGDFLRLGTEIQFDVDIGQIEVT